MPPKQQPRPGTVPPGAASPRAATPIDVGEAVPTPPDAEVLARHREVAAKLLEPESPEAAERRKRQEALAAQYAAPPVEDLPPAVAEPPEPSPTSFKMVITDPQGFEDPRTLRRIPSGSLFETADAELAAKLRAAGRAKDLDQGKVRGQFFTTCLVGSRSFGRGDIAELESTDLSASNLIELGYFRVLPHAHPGWALDKLPRDPRIPRGHPAYVEKEPIPMVEVRPLTAGLKGRVMFTRDQVGRFVEVREDLAIEAFYWKTAPIEKGGMRGVALKDKPERVFTRRGLRYLEALESNPTIMGRGPIY